MDPKEVKLTTTQKILPLLKAINEEIPWQIVLIFSLSLSAMVFGGGALPVAINDAPILDFIVRRIVCGFFMGAATFLMIGFIYFLVDEKILPLYKRVMKNYEEESYKTKKKLLEDIIDDEILK